MKIDTLTFIQHLLGGGGGGSFSSSSASSRLAAAHAPTSSAFLPHAPVLVPTVLHAVDDQFYKIASEALLVLETLVRVLRPVGAGTAAAAASDDGKWAEYVQKIYSCCLSRLRASDIDQEVKERAISCMGRVIANMGDRLQPNQLPECLPLLLDRRAHGTIKK